MEHYDGVMRISGNAVELSILDFEPVLFSAMHVHLFKEGSVQMRTVFDFFLQNEEEYERLRAILLAKSIRFSYMSVEHAKQLGMEVEEQSVLIIRVANNMLVFYRQHPQELRELHK